MDALQKTSDSALGASAREKLGGFVRVLRDNGFVIGLAELRDALIVMSSANAAFASRFRAALRALFCSRQSDWRKFDDLFDAYWLQRAKRSATRVFGAPQKAPSGLRSEPSKFQNSDDVQAEDIGRGEGEDSATGHGKSEGASRAELLAQTDFRHLTRSDDLAAAHELAEQLAQKMRARLTRRLKAQRRGEKLDLRRTIHKSIAHGGMPLDLAYRRRKDKPLRLVVLLDASGSMSLYSAIFLRFIHGVLTFFREAEAFVFHTRLIHISPALRERDAQRVVERMTLIAQGVGGGTRIGDSLATFNRWHARRVIHSRTCVMIVSDGYDTGPAAHLGAEMAALHRRCRKIVWLNPMIGWRDYAPEAAGMRAALPHIDLFAPAHNLASLAALEPYLARI
jgi:uncharacterized protein with von Willebrand factor type A (vWA) domain